MSSLNQEWGLLRAVHPNVLVVGAQSAVVDTLDRLRPNCRRPVATCEAGSLLVNPPPSQPGTLILRDVGKLMPKGQRYMMEWLDNNARDHIQVIATNAAALWPQVKDGYFMEALYYRLNVIYIDLTDGKRNRGDQTMKSSLLMPHGTAGCGNRPVRRASFIALSKK